MAPPQPLPLVAHVVTGGFSGATQVAIDLVRGARAAGASRSVLLLRRKRHTPMDRVQALRDEGLEVVLLPGWSHLATVQALARWCRREGPAVVVGHGFPEHLLARWAARWAGVPVRVQVEHNSRERYTAFKRWQVRALAPHTQAFVGVSQAVAEALRQQGLPAERVLAIPNGIDLSRFAEPGPDWAEREPAILMAARFSGQKDHLTLVEALAHLKRQHGLSPKLRLAGTGGARHEQRVRQAVSRWGLDAQVEFLGQRPDLPALMRAHRVLALSTHYEGQGLVLVEGMAAGCVVVGSDVPAVREVLAGGAWGELPAAGDVQAWTEALWRALTQPELGQRARAAQQQAHRQHTRAHMVDGYHRLFRQLMGAA